MKKLIFMLAMLLPFVAFSAIAQPTLQWEVAFGTPDGFNLYYKVLTDVNYQTIGVTPGTARNYDLSRLGLTPGVRYEFYLTATESGSESAPSDILRYTYPILQQVIEIPPDAQIIINIGIVP